MIQDFVATKVSLSLQGALTRIAGHCLGLSAYSGEMLLSKMQLKTLFRPVFNPAFEFSWPWEGAFPVACWQEGSGELFLHGVKLVATPADEP